MNKNIIISHCKLLTVQLILISLCIICAITEATFQSLQDESFQDSSQVQTASATDTISNYENLQIKKAQPDVACIKRPYSESFIQRITRKRSVRKKRSPSSEKKSKTLSNVAKNPKDARSAHKQGKGAKSANKKGKSANKKGKAIKHENKKGKGIKNENKKGKSVKSTNKKGKSAKSTNKKGKSAKSVNKKGKGIKSVNKKGKSAKSSKPKEARSTHKKPKGARSTNKKSNKSQSAHKKLKDTKNSDASTNLEKIDPELQKEIQKQEKGALKYLESIERNYSQLCHDDSIDAYAQHVGREAEDDNEGYAEEVAEDQAAEEQEGTEGPEDTEPSKDGGEEAGDPMSEFQQKIQKTIEKKFRHWRKFSDPMLRKEIAFLLRDGTGNMTEPDIQKLSDITGKMDDSFIQATVCEYKNEKNCKLYLEPDITLKMEGSRDYDELAWYWEQWHDSVGSKISSELYAEFIRLNNVLARANQYKDNVVQWMDAYNEWTPDWSPEKFRKIVFSLWQTIKPYYQIIHAYVRMKLRRLSNYSKRIKKCGYMPAHILGNMYAQTWSSLDDITKPYPQAPSLDATKAMRLQGYTPTKMMQLADEFFQGLGLMKATNAFWKHSVFERPPNVNMSCHASAFDMCLGKGSKDFRISMCATTTQRDFVTMHHELGHVQYFMQYSNLRYAFRGAASPAFDESVGDVLAMSVTTPEHLKCKLGLDLGPDIDCSVNDTKRDFKVTKTDMNHLFLTALDSFPFFPFAMAMDHWRWLVMEDKIDVKDYNKEWWRMRKEYQGIVPPNPRSPTSFDAAAKYHVVVHVSYVRYFLSTILQYQFYEALCKASGQYDPTKKGSQPLYRCDFSGSKKAGELFGNLLKLGSRKPWPEALEMITGQRKMSATPMLRYFKPLFQKLKAELKKANESECLSKPWRD